MISLTESTMMPRSDLLSLLNGLNLRRTAEDFDDFIARATKGRWPPELLLAEMARQEQMDRERRSMERRMKNARISKFKPMADYDWNWPSRIDRQAVERTLTGEFIRAKENIVLMAAQGLGKTMIARNIGHQAVLRGHSVLFTEASKMLLDLGAQETPRALQRRLRNYAAPDLLCIDEIGYLSYDARAADLLFQIVALRYEQKSIVLTSNLAFKDWATIFPNAACVTALIDRLTHHADILTIEGKSYRRREAEEGMKTRNARSAPGGKP